MEEEIIIALAKELAKRDLKSLEDLLCGMKFADAYRTLGGFNLEDWVDEDGDECSSFDVNYKSIATTIFKGEDGYCFVYDTFDVWLSDYSSPVATITLDMP